MNRILRRPMFRTGGSAEGITSGLPRQGYAHEPGHVKQDDYSKMKIGDLGDMDIGQLQELSKSMSYKPRGTNVYDFMTEMGLDLASRPAAGGIFQQLATSAKEPYSRYMERKQSAAEQEYGSESDMFKTMLSGAFDVAAAEKEGSSEGWLKQWEHEQIPVLNRTINELRKKQEDGTITPGEELDLQSAIEQKREIVNISPVLKAFLGTKQGGYMVTDEMDKLIAADQKLPEDERKYKSKRDPQIAIDAIANVERSLQVSMAKGGRVGYQNAGAVMPSAVPAAMQAAGPMDQGTEVPEELQNIDFETLRARLPSTITDDIVRLIANSAEAMEDFATIQTQQDINNFNKKYGVELVLPAEA